MKNDTTFVHMRSGDPLETQKCQKRAPRSLEFNFFAERQKRFSQNERIRADLQNVASDLVMIFQSLVMILGPNHTQYKISLTFSYKTTFERDL